MIGLFIAPEVLTYLRPQGSRPRPIYELSRPRPRPGKLISRRSRDLIELTHKALSSVSESTNHRRSAIDINCFPTLFNQFN